MKTYVVVIALLFSFGGLAAGDQAVQENGTTPIPQATPSNGSRAKRQVDQPGWVPATKGTETPSPAPAPSQQQIVSPDLEKSLVGLTDAVTKLVEKPIEKESDFSKVLDYAVKVVGVFISIIGCLITVFGFHRDRKSTGEASKESKRTETAIRAILFLVVVLVGLSLLSGLIQAALYVLFGLIMLLVALLIAAAHLVTFVDNNYELKVRVRKHFPELFGDSLPGEPPNSD